MAPASTPSKTTSPATPDVAAVLAEVKSLKGEIEQLKKPRKNASALLGGGAPNVMTGEHGERPFSFLKAAALANGMIRPDEAKEEANISERLYKHYHRFGFKASGQSYLVPFASENIPFDDTESETLVRDIREKTVMGSAMTKKIDPDEVDYFAKRAGRGAGYWQKTLGALTDTAGGVLVGFPALGELVDLQRNLEAFPNAGATETVLPPNGRIQYPKLANASTANWIGEAATISSSTPATGYLDLIAKKLAIMVYINNELLKFNTISAEAMTRLDMARVGALFADLAMLQGTGGTQPLGIINYTTQSGWSTGNDKLIAYTVTSNLFQPADAANMVELLPDPIQEPTAWIMRRDLWSKVINRRADSVTTGDGAGPFVFWISRGEAGGKPPYELYGTKVVRTSQVSNTRSSTKSYILVGYFPDWVIGRSGVMEFLASNVSDTAMTNDQTLLRGIQYIDAGARHPASFVFADNVNIA